MPSKTTIAVVLCVLCAAVLIPQQDRSKSAFSSLRNLNNNSPAFFPTKAMDQSTSVSKVPPNDQPSPDIRTIEQLRTKGKSVDDYPFIADDTVGVTIFPANHSANPITTVFPRSQDQEDILQKMIGNPPTTVDVDIFSSSFKDGVSTPFEANKNGFVRSAVTAYSDHRHLHIRPEDIWLAILTQLSSHINANAEQLRGSFVSHDGQKELRIVYGSGTRYTNDWGDFAHKIGVMIEQNVVDPELRSWIMPAFSTTTQHDVVVANIVMMASMQKYFTYSAFFTCGLPSVTLHGTKADYELILARIDKLRSYGTEPTRFADLLTPVLKRFVLTFDDPESASTKDFWNRIFKYKSYGSGAPDLSGWLTAFMFWDADGKALDRHTRDMKPGDEDADTTLWLDDMPYHLVSEDVAIPGYCSVPVFINDNGVKINATMLAGSIGMDVRSSGQKDADGDEVLDTVQPKTGWWIYENRDEAKKQKDDEGGRRPSV